MFSFTSQTALALGAAPHLITGASVAGAARKLCQIFIMCLTSM